VCLCVRECGVCTSASCATIEPVQGPEAYMAATGFLFFLKKTEISVCVFYRGTIY
jgi:hypothetical protein